MNPAARALDDKLAEIQRRARQDAIAHKSGWPVACPFSSIAAATEWRTEFDKRLAEAKK